MNEEQKQRYHERYAEEKQKGVKFYPDIIYKDIVVSFGLFILLVGLAIFVGVANEPKADPSDTSYIPRPEWYFLFLFEFLKYVPGAIEWVGAAVIPGVVIVVLFLLPFIDRNPNRHSSKRKLAISIMTVIVLGIVALTILAVATTPPQPETDTIAGTITEQIVVGEELYGLHCVECHGPDGEGGEIVGVEGLEGVVVKSISSQDEMYTRSDETFYNVIDYGQPDLGMTPFGRAYGGELGPGEIEAIVTFMRYTWDDRVEIPEEAALASAIPALGPDEIPSYEVHVQPIVKRYCISCHRPGKQNNDYFMSTYEEIMESGANAPNVIPGDINSLLLMSIRREEMPGLDPEVGPMPPTKALKEELLEIFRRWVLGGAPNTAAEAEALSPTPESAPPAYPEPEATP
ncbi:MAG: c-type cytochrome [Chloroflexota bacterium]|nr:c-type cytochrome [Chloroflexota bacterium]